MHHGVRRLYRYSTVIIPQKETSIRTCDKIFDFAVVWVKNLTDVIQCAI